jgi:hypothetical protein
LAIREKPIDVKKGQTTCRLKAEKKVLNTTFLAIAALLDIFVSSTFYVLYVIFRAHPSVWLHTTKRGQNNEKTWDF